MSQERARQAGEPTGELSTEERAELRALRRQVDQLRNDIEFFPKPSRATSASTHASGERYELMAPVKANLSG